MSRYPVAAILILQPQGGDGPLERFDGIPTPERRNENLYNLAPRQAKMRIAVVETTALSIEAEARILLAEVLLIG